MTPAMTSTERRIAIRLSLIYTCRMLGLFMILPVFTPYGMTLHGATPWLVGLSLSIYGASQALLQIPLGRLSDYIGRQPVIITGLVLFVIGSLIAGLSTHIDGVIVGRCLQGAGAIGSSLAALLADTTREEVRTRAMGIIGMTVGFSFFIAMLLGPLIAGYIGVSGLFWLSALLGLFGIQLLVRLPPSSTHTLHRDAEVDPAQFLTILCNPSLIRLNISVFLSHAILTSTFIALPVILLHDLRLESAQQWIIYLPALAVAFVLLFPAIILAESKRCLKVGLVFAVLFMGLAELGLYASSHSIVGTGIALCLFFTAFSFLEAVLPSLTSKIAPAAGKGTAMGIFSTAQFLGLFVGGLLGGAMLSQAHTLGVFLLAAILALIAVLVALTLAKPTYLTNKIMHIGPLSASQQQKLQAEWRLLPGVANVDLIPGDETAYLKVDKTLVSDEQLQKIIAQLR